MSGMSSPPATSSAPPSTGRADDLFALAKFVMSEESHAHLRNLHESEGRARDILDQAAASQARLDEAWSSFRAVSEKFGKDKIDFDETVQSHGVLHAERQSAVQAREAEVSRREEKCNERELAVKATELSLSQSYASRHDSLSSREKEISAKSQELINRESALERKQQAIYQAMRL